MTKLPHVVLAILFFVGCSRSGHHPEPIAPVQPTSPYDVRPIVLLIAYASELRFGPNFVWPKQKPRSVADSLSASIFTVIENSGLNTIPRKSLAFKVTINDKVVWFNPGDSPDPLRPGEEQTHWIQFTQLGSWLNKPGRYEVRLHAWLPERFGETNLDDNVLLQFVDVVEE